MSGLLIAGMLVDVPGVKIISPGEQPWAYLTMGKDAVRRTSGQWIRQLVVHKTIADNPERVLEGAGPAGGAEATASWWQHSDGKTYPLRNGAAHGVTGEDGIAACLADLVAVEAWHATVSNAWSVGWETREKADGTCWRVSLESTVAIALAICRNLGIQMQMPKLGSYSGHPIPRMIHGGPDMVGIYGHRSNTEDRGRWDPGEELFVMLADRGVEQFDFDHEEDRATWMRRQTDLNAQGHHLVVDGIPGPATVAALKKEGYVDGIYVLGKS